MCGCKICVIICYIKSSLNFYRLQNIKLLREKVRVKGGRMKRPGVEEKE